MENSRRRSASLPSVEDPGEDPDEDATINGGQRSGANRISGSLSSLPLPPLYPCIEVCAHCGKKVTDRNVVNEETQDAIDANTDCSCECHRQACSRSEKSLTRQEHIPPGGPNCLPGCGYSGLPCYYCSSFPSNRELPEPIGQQMNQAFQPTQIYTVELLGPPLDGFQSGSSTSPIEQRIIVQSEENPDAARRRKTCISLVVFIITINVAIAIVRMLSSDNRFNVY
ncbi:uncharacterized protein LOC135213575 [Macrobrachium nipponense]|uniref:uncharacterized protein LOC135213575 n=1 Tax=Macrobrachium nipponense TaxID=159736 RepID=UPI0030C833FD